jgi:integrase
MASTRLKEDTYHARWRDHLGNEKEKSTRIKVSVYGKRKAEKLAEIKAAEFEIADKSRGMIQFDYQSVIKASDKLPYEDKVKLAVYLSTYLPDGINTPLSNKLISFNEACTEFKNEVKREKSNQWFEHFDRDTQYLKDCLGENINIQDITVKQINKFINNRLDEGKAPGTVLRNLLSITQLMDHCLNVGYITFNPVNNANKPSNIVQKENEYTFIPSEIISKLINKNNIVDEHTENDFIFWTMFRYTGLSPIDISNLTKDVIKGEPGQLHIVRARSKTGVVAKIPVHKNLESLFNEYGDKCFGLLPTKGKRDSSTRRFKKLCLQYSNGELETPMYSLRHTFITELSLAGYEADDITLMTGHTTTKMLLKSYVKQTNQEAAHKAVNSIK